MQTILSEMNAITDFETHDVAHDTQQLEALQATQKRARAVVKSASPAEQLAFLEGYCALNERIGHQDSFGIMSHFAHTADGAYAALKASHGLEVQRLVESSVRRRLNGGTLQALRNFGTAARAIEVLVELQAQGVDFIGHGGKPKNGDFDYYLKVMREDVENGLDDDDDDE